MSYGTFKSLWYDSWWLQAYHEVRKYLVAENPDLVDKFDTMIAPLKTDPDFAVRHLRNVLDAEKLREVKAKIASIPIDDLNKSEFFSFGRHLMRNDPFFTELQKELVPLVEREVGEPVDPCYNFLSLYNNFGSCPLHMDSPEAKWTLDICIEQSDVWPIEFSDVIDWPVDLLDSDEPIDPDEVESAIEFREYCLEEGEAIIFSGSSQWHRRNAIPKKSQNNFCHLIFLHYVPMGTSEVVDVERWSDMLGDPVVGDIVRSIKMQIAELNRFAG